MRLWYIMGMFLPFFVYYLRGIISFLKTKWKSNPNYVKLPKYRSLVWKIHRLVSQISPYYLGLSKEGKVRYISRLIFVLPLKQFIPKEGEIITIEKKIIVLAGLIQLTFGLNKFVLPLFSKIAIYPSVFYSSLLKQNVKGLSFGKGYLMLSWLDSFKGFHKPDDNLNLVIHEWSHAFNFDHREDEARWLYVSLNWKSNKVIRAFDNMKHAKEKHTYFRSYAFSNKHEFFAVCVEHFFETPIEFSAKYPKLFNDLCTLLNQNPINTQGDYKIK